MLTYKGIILPPLYIVNAGSSAIAITCLHKVLCPVSSPVAAHVVVYLLIIIHQHSRTFYGPHFLVAFLAGAFCNFT